MRDRGNKPLYYCGSDNPTPEMLNIFAKNQDGSMPYDGVGLSAIIAWSAFMMLIGAVAHAVLF